MSTTDSVTIVPKVTPPAGTTLASVAFSINGPQPSISRYIAYDTLTPPNPFIAVTQDGLGNVVYDGGFPKFYNGQSGGLLPTSTFEQMPSQYKYMHNAINFVANPVKIAAGNRKVLFLGDVSAGGSYAVKSTDNTGFRTSFEKLATAMSLQLTIKDIDDYGGTLNPTLAELNQYALVILMSSSYNLPRISDAAVGAFINYRAAGNGLIFITDHGPDIPTIEAASVFNYSAFFSTANKVIVNFGAWFSGNVDRTPVNVGFLRTNYGDHPLYSGLTNAESMPAGGSESRVFVNDVTSFDATNFYGVQIVNPGVTVVRFLFGYSDGSVSLANVGATLPGTGTNALWGTFPRIAVAKPMERTQLVDLVHNANVSRNTDGGMYTWSTSDKKHVHSGAPISKWSWAFKI